MLRLLQCLVGLLLIASGLSSLEVVREVKDELEHLEDKSQHKLRFDINPGCPAESCSLNQSLISVVNLTVYDSPVAAVEHHWIWSVIGRPTVQLALTQPQDEAEIDWAALLGMTESIDSSIVYSQSPKYSAAIMLANLVEFDDVNNEGSPDSYSEDQIRVYSLLDFTWSRSVLENTTDRAAIQFIAANFTDKPKGEEDDNGKVTLDGILNITISAYASEGFGHWLPHLSHSPSTNQMDIQLDHLKSNSGFNHSRFALEMVLVSNAQKGTKIHRESTATLDDEHTPGIFTTQELVIPGYNESLQAYMQWRPVVYTSRTRDLSSSTDVNISSPVQVHKPSVEMKDTILYAMYGEDLNDMLVTRLNVTLGGVSDGFYKKTKYQAWTFSIGSGKPLHNGLSPILVLAVTVMFGILFFVLATSSIICIWKRCKARQGADYGRL